MTLRVAVACSGGRDSAALLVATAHAAAPLGVEVVVLHVHHGLSPHADTWLAHCAALSERSGLRFASRRLRSKPARGDSIEAWARRERYMALAEMALEQGADLVLLAHHRRDQAETWLLQALRGAGPAGLASMPRQAVREGLTWARPWLDQPRDALEAYALAQGIDYVDDDSNADPRFARNRLRLAVWPALIEAFPQAEASLAGAARRAGLARECLDELAAQDLAACTDRAADCAADDGADDGADRVADPAADRAADGAAEGAAESAALQVDRWQALSPGRRDNLLRAWLRQATGSAPPLSLLERLAGELTPMRPARWPVEGGELRCHRARLTYHRAPISAPPQRPPTPETALRIMRAGRYALPGWGGVLVVRRVTKHGVALARLSALVLRTRQGGESFQRAAGATSRSLKKQYQSLDVPAWERDGPLLFDADGALLFVPGLGIDARAWAALDQAQVSLQWEPRCAAG